MKVFNSAECYGWLSDKHFEYKQRQVIFPLMGFNVHFRPPLEIENYFTLADRLASFCEGGSALLWLTSWALYRRADMNLLLRFRALHGDNRTLIEAPGLLFEDNAQDVWKLGEMILYTLAFAYEGYVLREDASLIIRIEDSLVRVAGNDQKVVSKIQEELVDDREYC